jgi:hypothetical protein
LPLLLAGAIYCKLNAKKNMKKTYLSLLLILFTVTSYAQPWTLNTAKYEHSMTITARIKINGLYISQSNCWLGVFSGEECRGYVKAERMSNGEYFFFLTIFSNSVEGESLTLKFNNGYITLPPFPQTLKFQPDKIVGTPDLPFLITSPLEFSSTNFLTFSVVNQIGATTIDTVKKTIVLKVDGSAQLENLKPIFTAPVGTNIYVNNKLQESDVTTNNFLQPVTYTLKGIDGLESNWIVTISKSTTPNSYTISANVFPENSGTITGAKVYNSGEIVSLKASASKGYNFINWTENGTQVSTDSTYSFTASSNRTLVANFLIISDIPAFRETNSIKVYPNPVSDELIIEAENLKGSTGFEIINSVGQVISTGTFMPKTSIQTSQFPTGIYLLKVENGKTFDVRKIVKK